MENIIILKIKKDWDIMIKNKEQIKMEMKAEVIDIIEKYVDEMDEGSNGERFPIDSIELLLENVIRESKKVIVDRTSELVNSIDEEHEIAKKNKNTGKGI